MLKCQVGQSFPCKVRQELCELCKTSFYWPHFFGGDEGSLGREPFATVLINGWKWSPSLTIWDRMTWNHTENDLHKMMLFDHGTNDEARMFYWNVEDRVRQHSRWVTQTETIVQVQSGAPRFLNNSPNRCRWWYSYLILYRYHWYDMNQMTWRRVEIDIPPLRIALPLVLFLLLAGSSVASWPIPWSWEFLKLWVPTRFCFCEFI